MNIPQNKRSSGIWIAIFVRRKLLIRADEIIQQK